MLNKKPTVLGFKDALEILGISKTYLYTLVKENKIPHQKISNGTIFFKEDVIAFMDKRKERAKSDPRIKINK